MDKETFTDVTSGDKHEVDIFMKARLRGEDAFFLIHVENQSAAQSDFPKRTAATSPASPRNTTCPSTPSSCSPTTRPAARSRTALSLHFPARLCCNSVTKSFSSTASRLPWRRFVRQENPVASALMAKMKMSAKDRPKVKAECLRLLVSLKLEPARTKLIGGFVDSYRKLTAEEMEHYQRAVDKFAPTEREDTVEIVTSWEQRGIMQGKETLVVRLLRRRVGPVPDTLTARLDTLTAAQLDDLGEALLDFQTSADSQQWLDQH